MSIATACMVWRNPEDKRPLATLPVNDRPVQGLWDSGSDVTCLAQREFNLMKDRPPLKPYDSNLVAANGHSLHVLGTANLRYRVGEREFTWDTIIVRNLKSPLIIGLDLMEHHSVAIYVGKREISVGPDANSARSTVHSGPQSIPFDPTVGSCSREFSVNPYEAARIEVVTKEKPGAKILVKGPYIDEGVCEVNHKGQVSVLLQNRTYDKIRIKGRTPLCVIERLNPVQIRSPYGSPVPTETNLCTVQRGIPLHLSDSNLEPILKNIPAMVKGRFASLLRKYQKAFSATVDEIGKCHAIKQRIELLDPNLVTAKAPYRIPEALKPVAFEYVHKLLRQKVLEPSTSPFSSPLLLVKKPGADDPSLPVFRRYRCVQDYRSLNLNIKKDRYPLADTASLIDMVAQGNVLTTIDISAGFYNQMLEEESKELTAFSVSGLGHYHYTRSPMGICNSPSAFSRMMSFVVRNIPGVDIYVDDLVIVSKDFDSHLATLEQVLERFERYGLKIRVNKLQLAAETVNYLGFQISKTQGIRPGLAKTETIRQWQPPQDVTEIKQFIGLCSYFRRVVKDFSIIAKPLTVLTRKDSKYQKGTLPDDALQAFQRLKTILSSRPVLAAVNYGPEYQFILISDASTIGAGAILVQKGPDGLERPIGYASKTWSESEAKRAPFHLEAQALLFGVRHFRHYLIGRPVIFRTDHRPLVSLDKTSSPILDKIYAELEEYSFTMEYLKGSIMPADGLSRSALNPGRPLQTSQLSTEPCQGLNVDRIRNLQMADHFIKAVVCKLRYNRDPDAPHLRDWVQEVLPRAEIHDGIVGIRENHRFRILAPLDLRGTLLAIGHDQPLGGHQGAVKTYDRISQSWYWPGMRNQISNYAKSCPTCSENNTPQFHTKMPLRPLPEAKYVGDRVHIDLVGPYPSDRFGNRYALVMVDAFSNFIRIAPQPTKETEVTALSLLHHWVCNHSVMTRIQSDHGGEFCSKVMKHLNSKLGIHRHVLSSPYHPASNSKVERQNRSLVTYVRKFLEGNGDKWSDLIPSMCFALNTGLHEGKKMTAHQILYGSRPTLPLDVANPRHNYSEVPFEQMLQRHHQIQDQVREGQEEAFKRQKAAYDKTCKQRSFRPGMVVYLARPIKGPRHAKFQPLYSGPYVISDLKGNDNLVIRHAESGKSQTVHANRLKPGTAREQLVRSNDEAVIQDRESSVDEEPVTEGGKNVAPEKDAITRSDDGNLTPLSPEEAKPPDPPPGGSGRERPWTRSRAKQARPWPCKA